MDFTKVVVFFLSNNQYNEIKLFRVRFFYLLQKYFFIIEKVIFNNDVEKNLELGQDKLVYEKKKQKIEKKHSQADLLQNNKLRILNPRKK